MLFFRTWRPVNAREAVKRAYDLLVRTNARQIIDIASHPIVQRSGAKGANSVIADDTDHHRRRRGLMVYESVAICVFGGKYLWVLAHGYKGGHYPGGQYASDLVAFRYYLPREGCFPLKFSDAEFEEFVVHVGDMNNWFRSSLLTVMSDGRLIFTDENLKLSVVPRLKDFVLRSEMREAVFLSGERESLGYAHTYQRDFPGFLARAIAAYLDEESSRLSRHSLEPLGAA